MRIINHNDGKGVYKAVFPDTNIISNTCYRKVCFAKGERHSSTHGEAEWEVNFAFLQKKCNLSLISLFLL